MKEKFRGTLWILCGMLFFAMVITGCSKGKEEMPVTEPEESVEIEVQDETPVEEELP